MTTYDFPNTHISQVLKVWGVIVQLRRIPSRFRDFRTHLKVEARRKALHKELQELKGQVEVMEAINRDLAEVQQLRQRMLDLMQ